MAGVREQMMEMLSLVRTNAKRVPGRGFHHHSEARDINGYRVVCASSASAVNRGMNFGQTLKINFYVDDKKRGFQQALNEVEGGAKDIKPVGDANGERWASGPGIMLKKDERVCPRCKGYATFMVPGMKTPTRCTTCVGGVVAEPKPVGDSVAKGSAAFGHEKQMTPSVYLQKCAKAAIKDGESEETFVAQFKESARSMASAAYKAVAKDVKPVGDAMKVKCPLCETSLDTMRKNEVPDHEGLIPGKVCRGSSRLAAAKDVEITYHMAEKPKQPRPLLSVAEPADREKMKTIQPFGTKGKTPGATDDIKPVGDAMDYQCSYKLNGPIVKTVDAAKFHAWARKNKRTHSSFQDTLLSLRDFSGDKLIKDWEMDESA